MIFDKPSDWTLQDWRKSDAAKFMRKFDPTEWVDWQDMTETEKNKNPGGEITDGFARKVSDGEKQRRWDAMSTDEKNVIRSIPNFDAEKFYRITGVNVK
jgi:hypothetical protein